MRILVTGANGLLGSNLVRLLLAQNYEVSVFLPVWSESKTLEGLDIKRYYGDILNYETVENAVKDNDAVIHAAANTSVWPSRSKHICEINIRGTENIITAVLKYHLKRMIYVGSASSVNSKNNSISKHEYAGAKYGLDYIDSKYKALNMVMNAVENNQLPALAVLPTYMIGPYDSLPGSGKIILAVANGQIKFYTGGGKSFIHVKDVATAITNSLEMGTIGKYYIAGNENLTYQEFFKKVSTITGSSEPVIKMPDWLVKIVGYTGSITGKAFNIKPLLSYPLAKISCDRQFVSAEDTVKELMMPRTNIEIAIKDCYDWFSTNGYIKKMIN